MSFKLVLIVLLSATLLGAIQQTPNSSSQASNSRPALPAPQKMHRSASSRTPAPMMRRRCAMTLGKCAPWSAKWKPIWRSWTPHNRPLKHQFQLDIDMWNILINQMERRSYSNSR